MPKYNIFTRQLNQKNMGEYLNKLVSVSTYARLKKVNQETVRVWVVNKKVETIKIDTRNFVVLTDDEVEKFKNLR